MICRNQWKSTDNKVQSAIVDSCMTMSNKEKRGRMLVVRNLN